MNHNTKRERFLKSINYAYNLVREDFFERQSLIGSVYKN